MTTAKDIVAPRMQGLQKLEKALKKLDLSWKLIETTARVVSPAESAGYIATLEHTRLAFSRLASDMVAQIAQTHWQNCQHDLAARAQVAIDILVRNLFERTADVGFIATDGPLLDFVLAPEASAAAALQDRLAAYRDKYTVYDDILVLDTAARVLLSLQPRTDRGDAVPPWWGQLLGQHGYLEVYERSPWFGPGAPVLLYAHRILAPDGQPCGAVVLKFDLQSELASIFRALQRPHTVLLLRDTLGRLVASSDANRVAPGSTLALAAPDAASDTVPGQGLRQHGRDYLLAHCATRGYQGYQGPGWTAAALVDADQAFDQLQDDGPGSDDADIALDHPQLQHIIDQARAIEEDLNRVIWNGKLSESGARSGSALSPLFAEVGRTSQQTIAVFDDAIAELKTLLLRGRRAELAAHAALAVDIMDRNLYERANDCRWWALSEQLAQLLQSLQSDNRDAVAQQASPILAHLNSLYTVYRRVALFDRQGRIVAVSRDAHTLPNDCQLPPALLQRTLALVGPQAYAVSAMEPHALADGASTYLYCAPIRLAGTSQPLGGMALAFNCQDELQAMLQDALPPGSDTLGCFIDAQGRVLSSTSPDLAVGALAEFAATLQGPAEGGGALCQWQGRSYLVGMSSSPGYREFKTSDGYRDTVRSVLLRGIDQHRAASPRTTLPQPALDADSLYYGVVQCGRLLFGLAGAHVIEAVSAAKMAAAPVHSDAVGLLAYTVDGHSAMLPVYDSCRLSGQAAIADRHAAVAIVLRRADGPVALLVNRLMDVIACARLEPPPGGINPSTPWISGYIHDQQAGSEPVFTIDPNGLPIPR